jgi:hypothetical protein
MIEKEFLNFDENTPKMLGEFNISKLNPKEEMYFRMMYPRYGVLYLLSEPALAKSSIVKSISKKVTGKRNLNLLYVDIRLSMVDETDMGLYPSKELFKIKIKDIDGNVLEEKEEYFLNHVIPKWCYDVNNLENYDGAIICFDELNRAQKYQRNASLQIFLERTIGFTGFKFNDNVFMCACGNLGNADKTDVEELDSAHRGRLIPFRHTLILSEWIEYFANDNIHPVIVNFLKLNPELYYVKINENDDNDTVYCDPRNWDKFSRMIEMNFGKNADIKDFIDFIRLVGHSYIGAGNVPFISYCEDLCKITLDDIINNYKTVIENNILSKDKKSELLMKLKATDITKFNTKQTENIKLFILDLRKEELTSYLLYILDKNEFLVNEKLKEFMRDERFVRIVNLMKETVKS